MPIVRPIFLYSLFSILYFPALASAEPKPLPTKDTTIGRLALPIARESLAVSPDQEHLAFASKWGDATLEQKGIFLDKAVDEDHPPAASRPSDKTARDELAIYRDDKNGPRFTTVTIPVYSPDSQHLAYGGEKNDIWQLLLDGKPILTNVDGLTIAPVVFSPDSTHHAITYMKDSKWHVRNDDTDGASHDGIGLAAVAFSPDSKHLAYVARDKASWTPVVDEKPGDAFDRFGVFTWRPDSTGIAFTAAKKDHRWQVIAPGFTSKEYDALLKGLPVFSPDSKRLAFGIVIKKTWQVISNDGEGPILDQIRPDTIGFLRKPDNSGTRLLYVGQQAKTWKLFEEHASTEITFDAIFDDTFRISPDGLHYVVAGIRDGKAVLIRDGNPIGTFDVVGSGTVSFSADSKHIACAVARNNEWYIAVDGKIPVSIGLKGIGQQPIAFSPDGQRVAYTAIDIRGQWRLFIGADQAWQSGPYRNFFGTAHVNWRDDGRIVTIGIQKALALRVEAEVPK